MALHETKHYASQPTKRELRDLAGGNVIIGDVLNRIQYDLDADETSFTPGETRLCNQQRGDQTRFTVLVDNVRRKKLCWFCTWGKPCIFGSRCKYEHSKLRLKILGDVSVLLKSSGSMTALDRHPAWQYFNAKDQLWISFVEYDKRIVWARDGGESSAVLWEHFVRLFSSRRDARRERRMDKNNKMIEEGLKGTHPTSASSPSCGITDAVSQVATTLECAMAAMCPDTWITIMSFLSPIEVFHAALALASSRYSGAQRVPPDTSSRPLETGILDKRVLLAMLDKFWGIPEETFQNNSEQTESIQWHLKRFCHFTKATVHAYGVAIDAVTDDRKGVGKTRVVPQAELQAAEVDAPPLGRQESPRYGRWSSDGFMAVAEQPKPTRTFTVSLATSSSVDSPLSEGIGCIRHSESIVACTVGDSEIHVFQIDGGKRAASTSRPCKRQCELLDIPPMDSSSSQDILLHAGDGVLYWRDLHDPTLGVLGRTHLGRETNSRTSSSPWLAGLSMDIPNREVVLGRSTSLPGCYPRCKGSIDVFDLETQALVSSWDMPLDRGGLVALDRIVNPSWIVGSTGDSTVNAWDARMGGMSMAIGELTSVPMPRTIAQRGHVVVVGTAASSATVFDVRRPNSVLAPNIGGVGLPCSHVSVDGSALSVWYSNEEEDFVSVYDMSPVFGPIVELVPLQRRVTAVSQPAKRSSLADAPTIPAVRGPKVLSVLGITRPKHSGRGGMKHDLCIVTDVSDDSLVDGEREIDLDTLCSGHLHSPRHSTGHSGSSHVDGYTPGRTTSMRGLRRSVHTGFRQAR